MRALLLSALALGALCTSALAQVTCTGVTGVNSVPQNGLSCQQEPTTASYGATAVALAPAASATDIFCLTGSATRVVRLQYMRISGSTGTLVNAPVFLFKRVVADTGGTAATGTALPVPYALDSVNPAPTATAIAYTANPTINDASPGILDNDDLGLPTTGTAVGGGATIFDYSSRKSIEAPIVRGVAPQLCVNLNALTISTG